MGWKDTIADAKPSSWRDTINDQDDPNKSPVTATTTGLLNGASFGLADELGAGAKAAMNAITGVTGPLAGDDLSSIADDYRRNRDATRADFRAAAQANPKTAFAANIAGTIANPLTRLAPEAEAESVVASPFKNFPAAPGAPLFAEAPAAATAGSQLLRGAANGAAQGAAMGFGNSEGETVGDIARDTAVGGVIGGAGGTAGAGINQVANKAGAAASGALTNAADELATNPAIRAAAPGIGAAMGGGLGGVVGHATHIPGASLAGVVAGKEFLGPSIAKAVPWGLDRISDVVRASPGAFGKFAAPLQAAAQRGGNSLAATHFILQQTNPDYRELMRKMQGIEDDGNRQ